MSEGDYLRRSISATIADIARIQREMGVAVHDPSDREAYDIVARIERWLLAQGQVAE